MHFSGMLTTSHCQHTGSDGHPPPPRKTKRWMWALGGDPGPQYVTPSLMSLMFTYLALFPATGALCLMTLILSTIHCFFVCIFYLVPLCVLFLLYRDLFLLFSVWEMPTNQPSVVEISGTLYYTCHHMLLGHDLYISSNYTLHMFVSQLSWYISNMYSHRSLPD